MLIYHILQDLKNLSIIKLSIVHCPPVTNAIIKRPDPKYQLGFSVEDGIVSSCLLLFYDTMFVKLLSVWHSFNMISAIDLQFDAGWNS